MEHRARPRPYTVRATGLPAAGAAVLSALARLVAKFHGQGSLSFVWSYFMAVQLYGRYVIFSRPAQDSQLGFWRAYAVIVWSHKKESHYHHLINLPQVFDTEPEALSFGFTAARGWIHRNFGMEEDYKGHHIRVSADQDLSNKKWVPLIAVSWNENGTLRHRNFFNPLDWHRSKEDAINSAVTRATNWINAGKPL